jgi:hypothetical protein
MQANIQNYQGGGYVFIDATTKKPLTREFRKDLNTATKYWAKHYNKSPSVEMRPVADVQFFFMKYDI